LGQLGEIFALQKVVSLQEDLSQTGRSSGVVAIVEPVETMKLLYSRECVSRTYLPAATTHLMRVHIERIDGEVIGREVERLEYLGESEVLAVTVNNDFLWSSSAKQKPRLVLTTENAAFATYVGADAFGSCLPSDECAYQPF
jgi:hypothetical protein